MEGRIDLELSGNKELFLQIKSQSDLFVEMFHRLGDAFPQERLLKFHPKSKGSKVSKGYRLENCPYEVLDIFRDFDPKTGFNIRILQWWGHGLYFFVQFGTQHPFRKSLSAKTLNGFLTSDHPDPWDYPKLLSKKKSFIVESLQVGLEKEQFFQLFKEIGLVEDPDSLLEVLKREILLIMDNHN